MRVGAMMLGGLAGIACGLFLLSLAARAIIGPDAGVGAEFGASLFFIPISLVILPLGAFLGGRLGGTLHDRSVRIRHEGVSAGPTGEPDA